MKVQVSILLALLVATGCSSGVRYHVDSGVSLSTQDRERLEAAALGAWNGSSLKRVIVEATPLENADLIAWLKFAPVISRSGKREIYGSCWGGDDHWDCDEVSVSLRLSGAKDFIGIEPDISDSEVLKIIEYLRECPEFKPLDEPRRRLEHEEINDIRSIERAGPSAYVVETTELRGDVGLVLWVSKGSCGEQEGSLCITKASWWIS